MSPPPGFPYYSKSLGKYYRLAKDGREYVFQDGARMPVPAKAPATEPLDLATHTNPPQRTPNQNPSPKPSRKPNSPSPADEKPTKPTTIENLVAKMTLGATKEVTGTDETSGLQSHWEIIHYAEIRESLKRIRGPMDRSATSKRQESYNPDEVYLPGTVVEVQLVPPTSSGFSAATQITPRDPSALRTRVRLRRFVIVRTRPDNRPCFEAVAIKTYDSQGVAAPGVIKFHHTIIYTGREGIPTKDELPKRMPNGHLERGMQPTFIKVKTFDKACALDPMARLDFSDRYEFDFGVDKIKPFGEIHRDSRAAFFVQYQNVWATIQAAIRGGRILDSIIPAPPTTLQLSSSQLRHQKMLQRLRRYQAYGEEHKLTVPGRTMSLEELQSLAFHPTDQTNYFDQIRRRWRQEGWSPDSDDSDPEDSDSEDSDSGDSS